MARVINRHADKSSETVYIGRGSNWGNPYSIGRDGTRNQVIELYASHLWSRLKTGQVTLPQLRALDGEVLGCFCKPYACHGDVLIAAIQWAKRVDHIDPTEPPAWLVKYSCLTIEECEGE